jgi:hypothetical protein
MISKKKRSDLSQAAPNKTQKSNTMKKHYYFIKATFLTLLRNNLLPGALSNFDFFAIRAIFSKAPHIE